MNLGATDTQGRRCVGGVFDLGLGSNIESGNSGNPQWVIGDVFLVSFLCCWFVLDTYPS